MLTIGGRAPDVRQFIDFDKNRLEKSRNKPSTVSSSIVTNQSASFVPISLLQSSQKRVTKNWGTLEKQMSEEKPAEQRRNAVLRPKKKHVVFCSQVLVGVAPIYDRKISVSLNLELI